MRGEQLGSQRLPMGRGWHPLRERQPWGRAQLGKPTELRDGAVGAVGPSQRCPLHARREVLIAAAGEGRGAGIREPSPTGTKSFPELKLSSKAHQARPGS